MEKLLLINGSPRAPKSNSKRYGEIVLSYYGEKAEMVSVTKNNHEKLCEKAALSSDILFVFPLYADSLPVVLLDFLKALEKNRPLQKPVVHVLVNCGFIEPEQNQVCIDMIRLFCRQNGFPFGASLSVGGGEAILDTPFRFMVKRKIKALVNSIKKASYDSFAVTMPLSKKAYIKVSTSYWIQYGKRNGIAKEQMEAMEYE